MFAGRVILALAPVVLAAGVATMPAAAAAADPLTGVPVLTASSAQQSELAGGSAALPVPALSSPPEPTSQRGLPIAPETAPAPLTAVPVPTSPVAPAMAQDLSASTASPARVGPSTPIGGDAPTRRSRPRRAVARAGGIGPRASKAAPRTREGAAPENSRPPQSDRATGSTPARPLAFGNPARQALALSGFARLGDVVQYPAAAQTLLNGFRTEPTAGMMWALPLLAVMLLVGLGGFVRLSRPL